MPFLKSAGTMNWKYAIGELALIVAGVSMALAANSWYENQKERQLEAQVLGQLKVELEADLRFIIEQHEDLKKFNGFLGRLLTHVQNGQPYSEELDPYFAGLIGWRGIRYRTASYEEIKNYGFALLSNPEVRTRAIDLYETLFPGLIATSAVDSEFTRYQILPYVYERFRRIPGRGWVPLDYDQLRSDPLFENFVLSKQARLRSRLLPTIEEIIQSIQIILADIDSQLGSAS